VGAGRTLDLPAGRFFGLYLVQNATTAAFRAQNPSDLPGGGPVAFFSFAATNPDRLAHARFLGGGRFAWEDLLGGGSGNFDALTVRVRFGPPRGGRPAVALPLPAAPARSQPPSSPEQPPSLAALPPLVTVSLGSRASLPGALQDLSWQVAGGAVGLETLIQLRPPGDVYPVGGSLDVRPGSLPATGDVSYLKPDGSLTSEQTAYASGQASGHTAFNLPAGAKEGEWQAVVLLRDPGTGQVVSADAADFLVSSKPAIFLHVNRTLANTTDTIHAELLTNAGQTPQNVRVLATLQRPDGTEVSLPDQASGLRFLYEGPSTDASYDLFDGTLGATGAGNYLLRVRLLDADGNPLGLADAAIHVSDTPGALSGVVRADGVPVDGTKDKVAIVQALDVDDGAVTAESGVGTDGSYRMTLDPGRYLISAVVVGAQGNQRRADSTQLTVVGPEGTNLLLDLTLGAPVGPALDPPRNAAAPAGNALPKPRVFVALALQGASGFQATLEGSLRHRLQAPELSLTTAGDLQALAAFNQLRQQLNADFDLQEFIAALGVKFDFLIVGLAKRDVKNNLQVVDLRAVDPTTKPDPTVIRSVEVSAPGTTDGGMLDLVDQAADDLKDGLVEALLDARDRPVDPRFGLSLSENFVVPTANITVTVTLKDADGSVQPHKTIKLLVRQPGQAAAQVQPLYGETDDRGVFRTTFAARSVGDGGVTAVYQRPSGQAFRSAEQPFHVGDASGVELSSPDIFLRPGDDTTVRITVLDPSGLPADRATVYLSAEHGTLSSGTVVTDHFGHAQVQFTAGGGGEPRVDADYLPGGTTHEVARITWETAARPQENVNTSAPPNAAGTPAVADGGAADVFADVTVGSAGDAAVPVRFTVTGGGALVQADGQTDGTGRAHVVYVPPADGTGTATVTATTTVDGQDYTRSLVIAYQPAQVVKPVINPSSPFALFVGQKRQFTADMPVSWTVAAGGTGATINSSGLLTAGLLPGQVLVTATSTAHQSQKTSVVVNITPLTFRGTAKKFHATSETMNPPCGDSTANPGDFTATPTDFVLDSTQDVTVTILPSTRRDGSLTGDFTVSFQGSNVTPVGGYVLQASNDHFLVLGPDAYATIVSVGATGSASFTRAFAAGPETPQDLTRTGDTLAGFIDQSGLLQCDGTVLRSNYYEFTARLVGS
jgi:hypothetical protein